MDEFDVTTFQLHIDPGALDAASESLDRSGRPQLRLEASALVLHLPSPIQARVPHRTGPGGLRHPFKTERTAR